MPRNPISRSRVTAPLNCSNQSAFIHTKEFFPFVILSIILQVAIISSASIIDSASLLTNSRHYSKFHRPSAGVSSKASKRDLNTINSWNFRSLSSLQLSAQPPSASSSATINATRRNESFGINDVASVSSSSVRTRRWGKGRRRSNNWQLDDDDILANQLISKKRDLSAVDRKKYDDDLENQPSLADMRAQLGPIGLLTANAVEVGWTAAGSYMSGGLFGYFAGGVMGVSSLFRDSPNNIQPPLPTGKMIQRKMGNWNSQALAQGKSWGSLSAAFSGFHALTRVCRGGVEDRWNSIIGSACAGAYLSRQGGPQAMLQAASTYASFTYIMDRVLGSGQPSTGLNKEFGFTDAPIEDRGY